MIADSDGTWREIDIPKSLLEFKKWKTVYNLEPSVGSI